MAAEVPDGMAQTQESAAGSKGEMGVLALFAGLLDHRIERVILRDPPGSHWQGPALLNVLRITDIPAIAGAFAPRELLFLREMPAAFENTRETYRLLGQPDQIRTLVLAQPTAPAFPPLAWRSPPDSV
jgi:hypothetical protein